MKKPIAKKVAAKKEVAKKEVVEKKPIVKTPVKKVKTISKIVKPLFIEEPIIEINYSWDIESIEINNLTNVISQITYEFIGILIDQTHTISGTIVVPKIIDTHSKVETSDYKTLTKQEIIDYIISKVSERHLDVMKDMIIQNFKGTKIIDKTFWKS
jgi:hypothetical protein